MLTALVMLWVVTARTHVFAWDWLYVHRWSGLAGSAVLGAARDPALVLRAPRTGRSLLADLYFGRRLNRQFLGIDAKMFLYLVGAAMLALNLLSFPAHHVLTFDGNVSTGAVLYCALFIWFVVDYLVFESVHLYTYDIFAERVGFKLGWGCFTFYPYFYAIGLWATADRPDPGTPVVASRGLRPRLLRRLDALPGGQHAEVLLQDPSRNTSSWASSEPRALSDGTNALLASGFWAVSRHVNYLGEILMATGLTLVLGYPGVWEAWLYPLYYVALLVARERADERRCAAKYGELWTEYTRRVPQRIVPWLY